MIRDAARILKRYDELKAERSPLEDIWKECYAVSYPLRGVGLYTNSLLDVKSGWSLAREQQARLYDTTVTNATRLLASSLLSGLTPANSQWFLKTVPNATQEERAWLEDASFVTWKNIHASNYSEVAFEGLLDAVVTGMFAIFVREGIDRPFEFQLWDLANLYATSSSRSGAVDTVYYRFSLTAAQALSEYGDAAGAMVMEAASGRPDELFEYVNVIGPRLRVRELELPIASVTVCCRTREIVKESGYHEMPVIIPRLITLPNSPYSQGLVYEALPTAKTLNRLVETVLGSADMAVAGMWGAVDDGVLNPKAVKVGPRKIITVASRDSIFPLNPGSDFQVAQWMIQGLQTDIRKILLSDQLQAQDGPQMTATEIHVRVDMIRKMLGPNYERLQDEFLRRLVDRCFNILWRAGVFAQPPESLKGRMSNITYLSPLARAQQMEEVQAMERYEMSLSQMAQLGHPEALDNYNWDLVARRKAELMNVPAMFIVPEQAVAQQRQARAEQAQQQQMQQAAMAEMGNM